MKYVFVLLTSLVLFSCSDSFINHELKAERAGDCSGFSANIKLTSNINGERFEFFSCIDDGFDGKNYTVKRAGDSIVVDFPATEGTKKALYKMILDIDAKPRYSKILLNGRPITMIPKER